MTLSEKNSQPRKILSLFGSKQEKRDGDCGRIDKFHGKRDENKQA